MKLQTDNFINDLERWAKAYKNQLKILSYSKNTIDLYERVTDQFIEYSLQYQDEMQMKDIKSVFIIGFLSFLEDEVKRKGKQPKNGSFLSKSTKSTYLKAIKVFFSFISDNNNEFYTYDRYFKNIKIADSSRDDEKIVYLSEAEISRLLNILEKEKSNRNSFTPYRNSLLVKLLLYAGLRISEALNLKLEDFADSNNGNMWKIKIYGKGGKNQKVFIAKKFIEDELEYFKNVKNLGANELLMQTKNGKKWNRINAYETVNILYKKAQIYNKKGLHLLRHTLAMRLTQRDVNPIIIQKILRHNSIMTTTIYAKATEGDIAKVLE